MVGAESTTYAPIPQIPEIGLVSSECPSILQFSLDLYSNIRAGMSSYLWAPTAMVANEAILASELRGRLTTFQSLIVDRCGRFSPHPTTLPPPTYRGWRATVSSGKVGQPTDPVRAHLLSFFWWSGGDRHHAGYLLRLRGAPRVRYSLRTRLLQTGMSSLEASVNSIPRGILVNCGFPVAWIEQASESPNHHSQEQHVCPVP